MSGNGPAGTRGRAGGRHVLVTGGAGYVGSVLVQELLARGHSVRVLDVLLHGEASLLSSWGHPRFEFVHGDVRDHEKAAAAVAGVDSVVHLAAIVGDPACQRLPDLARETNVQATAGLLDAASSAGVRRFVFLSTCSNYGKMADADAYVTEESELRPVSLYAETKVAAETDVISRCSSEFETCVLRLATVYGVSPRMRFDLTVNQFTRDMALQRPLEVYGVQYWRPYIHVRDAAKALCSVLEAESEEVAGHVFNAGATAENYRKADLLRILEPRFPDADVKVVVATGDDPRDYRVSFEKIREGLGFIPAYTVTDGIDQVSALVGSSLISDPDAPRYTN